MYIIFFSFRFISQQTYRASTGVHGILLLRASSTLPQHNPINTRFCCKSTLPSVPGPEVSKTKIITIEFNIVYWHKIAITKMTDFDNILFQPQPTKLSS